MLLTGTFKFLGVDKRQGFKDKNKTVYVLGLGQGLDSLRLYIEPEQYGAYLTIPPYTDVTVTVDMNPVTNRLNLQDLTF